MGEDREYVQEVAESLKSSGVTVFYDEYNKANLWGKDLYEHFSKIYQINSMYVIMFISKHYEQKLWTTHEKKMAQARAFSENREYILPVRFDDTKIPSVPETIGYVDAREESPVELADLVREKLKSEGVSFTKQKALSDLKLKAQADAIVVSLRKRLDAYESQLEAIEPSFPVREENYDIQLKKKDRLTTWLMRDYESNYRSDATLYKNELVARLNLDDRDKYIDTTYDNPMNIYGIYEVVSDLDKLIKMLED